MNCGVDLALLWLWCRLAAAPLIRPLAWELPYAMGVALKRPKKKTFKNCESLCCTPLPCKTSYINYRSIKKKRGVPVVAQWLMNPTRNHKVAGLIPGLAQWVKDLALP